MLIAFNFLIRVQHLTGPIACKWWIKLETTGKIILFVMKCESIRQEMFVFGALSCILSRFF